jgi:TolA-binding protein
MKTIKKILPLLLLFLTVNANAQIINHDNLQIVDINEHYGSGIIHHSILDIEQGLIKTAELRLIEAIKKYPNSPANDLAVLLKANTDLQSGNNFVAVKTLQVFIATRNNSPFIPSAYLFSGYIELESKNYASAEMNFKQARNTAQSDKIERSDKEHYEDISHSATYWLAISLSMQGKYIEAIPYFDSTHKNNPHKQYAAQAIFALGSIAEMDKDYEKAIKYYEQIQSDYRFSNVILTSLVRNANCNLMLRTPQAALMSIQRAENAHQQILNRDSIGRLYAKQDFNKNFNENVLYLKGEAFNQVENYEQAVLSFEQLIKNYPNSDLVDLANMGLGWAFLNRREPDYYRAIRYFDLVINGKSDENSNVKALAHLNKITALKKLGRTEDAQSELSMLSVRPNFPMIAFVQLELGQIYYEKGDYDLARRTLERAEREADNPKVQIRIAALLAASYLELRQYARAVPMYKKVEQFAENSNDILIPNRSWYLNEARLKQGSALVLNQRSAEAIPLLLKFIADNSTHTSIDEALFWLAEAYYRSDMLRNSAETYDRVVTNFPLSNRREEALYGLGWSHFRLEQFNHSSRAFDLLVKEFPRSEFATEVLTRQADGFYRVKNYARASEYYSRAAKQGPNTEEGQYAAYQLAHTLYRENKYEQAITAALNFVRQYPKTPIAPNALYLIAWIRFQQARYPEAIDNFHFLIKTYPQSRLVPRAYFAIADAYYNMGNFEHAIEGYRTIVDQFPSDALAPEAMKSIQYALMALGRDAEAIGIAEQYIDNNPTSPFIEDFRYKKAEMFYSGRRFPDAISEYEAFAQAFPESARTAEALYWMGKSYASMNDFDNASKTFMRLYKQFPKNDFASTGLLEYGLLLKQQNMIDSAHSIFKTVEAEFPKNDAAPQAGFERAILFFGRGDTLSAVSQFKAVADKYPETDYGDQSRYRVGMFYRMKGYNEAAINEFAKIAEVYDNPVISAEARYRMGELYLKMDDQKNAQICFEIIREKFADYEDWFSLGMLGLGEIYERQGNTDEAIEIYEIIRQLRPDDEFGKTATQRLRRLR